MHIRITGRIRNHIAGRIHIHIAGRMHIRITGRIRNHIGIAGQINPCISILRFPGHGSGCAGIVNRFNRSVL